MCIAEKRVSVSVDVYSRGGLRLLSQAMKNEIAAYNSLIKAIKPKAERLDAKGEDTFTLLNFWRENEEGNGIDSFAYVLRAVLANSPNSIPPERVFSILNDTFDDDQDSSYADYIELSLQLQFKNRPCGCMAEP